MNLQDNNVHMYEGRREGRYMSDNRFVSFRKLVLFLSLTALCLAQGDWQTVTELPSVDWQGITGVKKALALKIMRTEGCTCGCDMKVAECRMKDHSCAYSKKIANTVAKEVAAGKTEAVIRADLKKMATEPPPVLDDPVKISTAGDPVRGPANARVTIVEFSDFQCPFCSTAVAATRVLLHEFPNDVKLVFKQFPLTDKHSQAEFGAEAALAAQAQGKFWEMHDLLYAGYPDISRATVMAYGRKLGLDMTRFTAELNSHKYAARVHAEEQEGEDLDVAGTPTFFINGKKFNDTFDEATVAPLIRNELK
jgi:protein-disulfide isomerase